MSALEARRSNAQLRRLQVLLLLLIFWDLLAVMAELSFGSSLMKIEDGKMGGLLGARVSLSGAALMPVAVYFYGLVRNPLRHRGVIWAAVVEQGAAALFAVYHVATDNLTSEAAIVALAVSLPLLVLLLLNMPHGEARVRYGE